MVPRHHFGAKFQSDSRGHLRRNQPPSPASFRNALSHVSAPQSLHLPGAPRARAGHLLLEETEGAGQDRKWGWQGKRWPHSSVSWTSLPLPLCAARPGHRTRAMPSPGDLTSLPSSSMQPESRRNGQVSSKTSEVTLWVRAQLCELHHLVASRKKCQGHHGRGGGGAEGFVTGSASIKSPDAQHGGSSSAP